MSFPDYEGKDYYESDPDEPIISAGEHNNHANASGNCSSSLDPLLLSINIPLTQFRRKDPPSNFHNR